MHPLYCLFVLTKGAIVSLTPQTIVYLLLTGLVVGAVSGMIGIGGGTLVIPALIYFFGFSQLKANGTSLAMLLPPIGVFAVMEYARKGNIDWRFALLLAIGFAIGGFVGGKFANSPYAKETGLRIMFSVLMLYVVGRMLFRADGRAMAALKTCLLIFGYLGTYVVMRLLGRRWSKMPYWPAVYQERRKVPVQHDYEI
jgi:uncharacterized membrane protein YfcA